MFLSVTNVAHIIKYAWNIASESALTSININTDLSFRQDDSEDFPTVTAKAFMGSDSLFCLYSKFQVLIKYWNLKLNGRHLGNLKIKNNKLTRL